MRQSGDALVESLGITTPLRVLDLGCATAVPLARLGAEVVGIDIARNLVDAGNKRAAEAGLNRLMNIGVGAVREKLLAREQHLASNPSPYFLWRTFPATLSRNTSPTA